MFDHKPRIEGVLKPFSGSHLRRASTVADCTQNQQESRRGGDHCTRRILVVLVALDSIPETTLSRILLSLPICHTTQQEFVHDSAYYLMGSSQKEETLLCDSNRPVSYLPCGNFPVQIFAGAHVDRQELAMTTLA